MVSSEEDIIFLRDLCLRTHGAECARCVAACPYDAIEFNEANEAYIYADACSHCGICLGVCDAFSNARITAADLYARLRRVAQRGERPILTCTRNLPPDFEPAANVVTVPCLATLSPEMWALALAEDLGVCTSIELEKCEDCVRAGNTGALLWEHALNTAQEWSGRSVAFVDEVPQKEQLVRDLVNPDDVDRRAVFDNLVSDVNDIASGKRRVRNSEVLQQFYEQRERARAHARLKLNDTPELNKFAPLGTMRKTMFPKRKLLLEALDAQPEMASRVPLALSRNNDRCDATLACVKACPTGARFPHPETGELTIDARYCIGCGICVDACPYGAAELIETTATDLLS